MKYDQKQTGDYNVQLHLKDFHIFALLGDDPWGSLGDYDYNYDYSDLTIKPSPPSFTSENPSSTSSTTETSNAEITIQEQSHSSVNPESTNSSSSTSKPTFEPFSTAESQQPLVSSTPKTEKTTKPENSPFTSISLIPVKIISDSYNDKPFPLGEILHYRKCADGFSKDAQGRCRKITRKNSQLPFGFTRLASNLASRIRKVAALRDPTQ
ncbi:hypothetical protein RN001_012071 [Aquatica leii]|uniref:Uncharacterized protein n=1 Tax=Aquatica leii TaxID=1421715 RepID=A0AAN7P2H7_9COLE|nr:hypothetical protein RN001_012071 [Aquatica leii]